MLEVQNLSVRFGALPAVDEVSFTVREGEWLMIVGPNGAGKSTLLSAIAQGTPYRGEIRLGGQDARRMRPRERARWLGMLSQSHTVGYAFTVEEIVRLGRYAYAGMLGGGAEEDARAVEDALAKTGMLPYRDHSALTLSGGELQRAFLAQVFAQDPRLLILDEPTNHLDLAYQKQVFELIWEWLAQPGRAAVSVVHDLSLARLYGTHALLLNGGKAAAAGPIGDALRPELLQRVYGLDVYSWMQTLLQPWIAPRPEPLD